MASPLPPPGGQRLVVARRGAPPGSLRGVLAALGGLPRPALRRLLTSVPVAARGKGGNVVGDLAQQLDQGLNFSIIQSLRTGNMLLDMVVCMIVPVLIRYLLLGNYAGMLQTLLMPLTGWFGGKRHIRVIEYTDGGNTRFRFNPMIEDATSVLESTDRNNLLQKAIKMFMAEKYTINDYTMETNLQATKKIKMETKSDQYGTRGTFSGSYQQLLSFAVHRLPRKGQWTLVDKPRRIWFMQTVNEQQAGTDANPVKETKTIIQIAGRSAEEVNAWISEAFEWYKEQRKSEQDLSRFFYLAISDKDSKSESSGKPKSSLFKQYLLSDHKTFNSLFFPEKETLLSLIDNFLKKQGKFAIEGFPDKLGLLLDGPPGTGKTSLIKALAHYCNRHVVSVNLAKIKTNQELMDLLFDLVFPVQGGDFPVKLKFQDLIFVMEDVDAASKVVYARGGTKKKVAKKKADKKQTKLNKAENVTAEVAEGEKTGAGEASASGRAPPPEMPKLLRMISARSGNGDEDEDGDGKGDEEEEAEEEEEEEATDEESPAGKKGGSEAVVRELIGAVLDSSKRDASGSGPEDDKNKSFAGPWKSKFSYEGEDDLNLAGLLNVLDGVVDSPGRIVVMTTNHPDKLDPALIRPGRINKRIHLSYVQAPSLCSMAEHYMLVKLTEEDRRQLEGVCRKIRISPAQVEQCCAESENVPDLIRHLEELR